MNEFKAGDTVKIKDVKGISCAIIEGYKNDDIATLIKHKDYLALPGKTSPTPLIVVDYELEALELVKSKITKKQLANELKAVREEVAELRKVVEDLKKPTEFFTNEAEVAKPIVLSNQLRAEIIEKAKEFVAAQYIEDGIIEVSGEFFDNLRARTKFIVGKRTVAVLIKGANSGKYYAKGIAKCNPSDTFNEHIGKAIALGRALELDVSEFENAVQPDLAVGQVIRVVMSDGLLTDLFRTVEDINENGWPVYHEGWGQCSIYKIEDDTNAAYGGTKSV